MDADYHPLARRMLDAIPRLIRSTSAFFKRNQSLSFPESKLASELSTYPDPEAIRAAYTQGGVLFEVAADHVHAFTRILIEPADAFAPWAVVRAAVETGAHAAWLLDPAVGPEERAARGFATRFD